MGKNNRRGKRDRGAPGGDDYHQKKKAKNVEGEQQGVEGSTDTNPQHKGGWVSSKDKENAQFVEFYKNVGVIPEGEWETFYASLRRLLPTTFRITSSTPFAEYIRHLIKTEFNQSLQGIKIDEEDIHPPQPLPWYPEEYCWQFNIGRSQLRRSEALKRFHTFLVALTEEGFVSRQEAVSMIPPLLLDVQSHHRVLDMCAAPGSKTAQLLESVLRSTPTNTLPTGSVIANDLDNKRCYMLVHQTNRLASPALMVTNHEATGYPTLTLPNNGGDRLFDRVLCDVPCSGDGTLRKNVDLWKRWAPTLGLGIHSLQTTIAKRGIQMLAEGGNIVYSTCSLNPVEDEAVVAELLRHGKGALELVDVSDKLPGLKRCNGLSSWRILDKDGKWYERHSDLDGFRQRRIPKSCFPPTAEEATTLGLNKCVRILPHHQDTGGFFIALLHKKASIPSEAETTTSTETIETTIESVDSTESSSSSTSTPAATDLQNKTASKQQKNQRKQRTFNESPFLRLNDTWKPITDEIFEFYGISEDFPKECLRTRSEKSPTIYFLTPGVNEILEGSESKLKIIHAGVKLFQRRDYEDVKCSYRICAEGLHYILPYITKRKLTVSLEDFHIFFKHEVPLFSEFSPAFATALRELDVGSAVVTVDLSSCEHLKSIDVPIWRARASTRLFVAKTEAAVLSRLLFKEELAPQGATNAADKGKEAEVVTKEAETKTEGEAETGKEQDTVSEPMKE